MRLIDADVLYERLKADEELARDRVIDTPSSFLNGAVNPSAIRYMAQLNERTRFKEMVFDAPTIEERKTGVWIEFDSDEDKYDVIKCSSCKHTFTVDSYHWTDIGFVKDDFKFCPNCGAKMDAEVTA